MNMTSILILLAYWASAIPGYYILRYDWIHDFSWTTSERSLVVGMGFLLGPALTSASLLVLVTSSIGRRPSRVLKERR